MRGRSEQRGARHDSCKYLYQFKILQKVQYLYQSLILQKLLKTVVASYDLG
jgi:uncharacterized protein YqgQ